LNQRDPVGDGGDPVSEIGLLGDHIDNLGLWRLLEAITSAQNRQKNHGECKPQDR
jgi:hypothetical protein